jgi:cytochrome c peroxidase
MPRQSHFVKTKTETQALAATLSHFCLRMPVKTGACLWKSAVLAALLCSAIFACAMNVNAESSTANDGKDNSAAVRAFGKTLFFSNQLSINREIACATCHDPAHAYADGRATARGRDGQSTQRNTPSLLTATQYTRWSWDGRNQTLEAQVLEPLFSAAEHGLTNERHALSIVRDTPALASQYTHAFGRDAAYTIENIAIALAEYVRQIAQSHVAISATSSAQIDEGRALFNGKAGCSQCHDPARGFTDNQFHLRHQGALEQNEATRAAINRLRLKTNTSKYQRNTNDATIASLGAFMANLDPEDTGKFRTPSLLHAGLTAPYMHDGSVATLREAIEIEVKIRAPRTRFSASEIDSLTAYVASIGDVAPDKVAKSSP